MSNKHEQAADELLAAAGLDPETGTEASGDMPEPSEAERIAKAMELLIAENAELKDRVLRAAAEMENLRHRTARDVRDESLRLAARLPRAVEGRQTTDERRRSAVRAHEGGHHLLLFELRPGIR